MTNLGGYGRQFIDDDDISAVVSVLRSDFLTQGPVVRAFEKKICEITGARFAVAVSNGTSALHLAVASLNLDSGKGVTSPITFMASSNAFIYNGLIPDFADIDKKSYNLSADSLKNRIDGDTKVVIPVHFAGQVCDMQEISKIAKEREVFVIEDASHALGSKYFDGSMVGSCKFCDLTTFSFHPVKTITCGEGGAITTNDENLYKRLLMLRNHGISKDSDNFVFKNEGVWYHEMQMLGFNFRMSDIHASLGVSQLGKLDFFAKKRRELVDFYNELFEDVDFVQTPFEFHCGNAVFHLYVVLIDFEGIGISRNDFMLRLKGKNIGSQVHYIPVYRQPFYEKYGFDKDDFPNAENFYKKALSLPLFPQMTKKDVGFVVKSIIDIAEKK